MISGRCLSCGAALESWYSEVEDPQTREVFAIDACVSCGLGQTRPAPEDLGRYYGAAYHGGRHGFTAEWCARRRIRLVQETAGAARGRKLLDVGCGDGTFLLSARDAGWSVYGTELNPQPARDAGLEVRGSIDEIASEGPFHCVTLWHTLEHFRNPMETMKAVRRVLAPDGVVVAAVPDARGLQASTFGKHWFHLDVPRHLFHFGAHSLAELMRRAGFEETKSWHQEFEYDVMGWTQSALNAVLKTPNVFFARVTGRKPATGGAETAANLVLGSALSAAAVPATWVGTLARKGGTLIIAARPAAV